MKTRWNGIGRTVGMTSAAVAGVCLSSSVASAWTTSRDQDFETEFDIAPEAPASADGQRESDVAAAPAAEQSAQTVGSYLDRLVRRAEDVDVMPECLPEKQPAATETRGGEDAAATALDEEAWQAFMAELIGPPFEETTEAQPAAVSESETQTGSRTEPAATESEPAESASVAEPVSIAVPVSVDDACCPAEEAARNVVAAVRPVLEFVPFRWLSEHPIEINVKLTTPARHDEARLSFFP